MNTRRDRIKQVRMRVVAVGVALFLAALGGVVAGGKQPATKVAHAASTTGSAAATTSTQTYDDDSSSYDDSGSNSYAPTPMTSRSS